MLIVRRYSSSNLRRRMPMRVSKHPSDRGGDIPGGLAIFFLSGGASELPGITWSEKVPCCKIRVAYLAVHDPKGL